MLCSVNYVHKHAYYPIFYALRAAFMHDPTFCFGTSDFLYESPGLSSFSSPSDALLLPTQNVNIPCNFIFWRACRYLLSVLSVLGDFPFFIFAFQSVRAYYMITRTTSRYLLATGGNTGAMYNTDTTSLATKPTTCTGE